LIAKAQSSFESHIPVWAASMIRLAMTTVMGSARLTIRKACNAFSYAVASRSTSSGLTTLSSALDKLPWANLDRRDCKFSELKATS
jgi:hypothetical protein